MLGEGWRRAEGKRARVVAIKNESEEEQT